MRIFRDPDPTDATASNPPVGEVKAPPATFSMDKAEYDRLKAIETEHASTAAKVKELEQYKSAASVLMRGEADPNTTVGSIKTLLKMEGYTDAQIDNYIQQNFTNDTPTPPTRKKQSVNDEEPIQESPEVLALKQQVNILSESQARTEKSRLEGHLQDSIEEAIENTNELSTLIEALAGPNNPDGEGETSTRRSDVLRTVQKEIDRETRDLLKERRAAANGRFDERWIPEEAVKAAKAVYSKYRTLVGDPSRLGRTPETNAGEDYIKNVKPVPAPVYDKKASPAEQQTKTRNWVVDTLLRAEAEVGRGGKTAV